MLATIVRFCIQKMNLLKGVVDLVLLASTFVNNHMTMVYEYVGKKPVKVLQCGCVTGTKEGKFLKKLWCYVGGRV